MTSPSIKYQTYREGGKFGWMYAATNGGSRLMMKSEAIFDTAEEAIETANEVNDHVVLGGHDEE